MLYLYMEKYKTATPVFTLQKKIGLLIVLLGTIMSVFGLYGFAERLPPVQFAIAEYCFMLWFPVVLAGIVTYASARKIYKVS